LAAAVALALLIIGALVWLGQSGADDAAAPSTAIAAVQVPRSGPVLKIGVVPERDIFAQRKRYLVLADYLSQKLDRPVEIATAAAYQDILRDIGSNSIDAAFLGSFTTVLAVDRLHTRVIARPVAEGEVVSYRGVIVVPEKSDARSIADLRGKRVALVRMTMAGHLFPFAQFGRLGMLDSELSVKPVWVGTHDDVILEVSAGHADAGALKDLRLDDYEKQHGAAAVRRLASSDPVPENAFVVRSGLEEDLVAKLSDLLLQMNEDPRGKQTLEQFGAVRFDPCRINQYTAVYDMIDMLGSNWPKLGIAGDPPKRPTQ
jgi:phosphonate transport system substrate-binding protein